MVKYDSCFNLFSEDECREFSYKIESILRNKPPLTCLELDLLFGDIADYYIESKKYNLQIDELYFDKILDIYDDKLREDDKFNVLLTINRCDSFIKYAKKHYNLFKKKFEKTVFVTDDKFSEEDTIIDIKESFDLCYPNNDYKLVVFPYYNDIIIPAYQLFFKELKFYNGSNIIKFPSAFLFKINFEKILEAFLGAIEENNENDMNHIIVIFIRKIEREFVKNSCNEEYIKNKLKIILNSFKDSKGIERLLKIIYSNKIMNNIMFSFYEILRNNIMFSFYEILRNNIDNYIIDDEFQEDLLSLSYIKNLNKLEELSAQQKNDSLLYLKCFQVFLKEFLINYRDELVEGDINIIEVLFKRLINHRNIFDILTIDNRKSLYFYYKTNILFLNIDISFELIKKFNARQYLKLVDLYEKAVNSDNYSLNNYRIYSFIILSLDILGYDLTKKIINKNFKFFESNIAYLKDKSDDYVNKIKPLLLDFIDNVNLGKENSLYSIFKCFDLLYEQKNIKITINRIEKMLDSIFYALLPNNYNIANNLEKLNFIYKGVPFNEKIAGIKLYNLYRFRLVSSIPDVQGKVGNCVYQMVDMHSAEILSNGIEKYIVGDKRISSCLTPAGKASSCLKHGALNPNGRFFKVTHKDKIVAYSWVWRSGEVLCFDNIEVTENIYNLDDADYIIYTAYKEAAESIRKITNINEENGIKLVIIGRNKIDVFNRFIDKLETVNKYTNNLFKPNSKDELYLEDSSKKQLILSGKYSDYLKTEDIEPIYKYQRKQYKCFIECNKKSLLDEINSIYFDYCIEHDKKYIPLDFNYINGYINEDWYIGFKRDNTYDFYYRGEDKRLFKEAESYIKIRENKKEKSPYIIKTLKEKINILLNIKNIKFNEEKIISYLQNAEKEKFILKEEYYTHSPKDLKIFSQILIDSAITSAEYGNHDGGSGANGKNFISVAKVNSDAYENYVDSKTFILTDDICAFETQRMDNLLDAFTYSNYPFRSSGHFGEWQVLNKISLDKSLGIFVSSNKIMELVQIIYLQELLQNNIPLVLLEDNTLIDKNIIKKYLKVIK